MSQEERPVIDFQNAALAQLRNRVHSLDSDRNALLESARDHRIAEHQVHQAVLAVLDAEGLEHAIHSITADWVDILGLDVIVLALVSGPQAMHLSATGVHFLKAHDLRAMIPGANPVHLSTTPQGTPLFGPAASLVRSQALIRLSPAEPLPQGILALGTRTEHSFEGMTHTEPLTFLGAVVERVLKRWLLA